MICRSLEGRKPFAVRPAVVEDGPDRCAAITQAHAEDALAKSQKAASGHPPAHPRSLDVRTGHRNGPRRAGRPARVKANTARDPCADAARGGRARD